MSSKINLQTCEYARKSSIFQDNQLISNINVVSKEKNCNSKCIENMIVGNTESAKIKKWIRNNHIEK